MTSSQIQQIQRMLMNNPSLIVAEKGRKTLNCGNY